jgi:cell division septum initiation protein DivIVA
MALLLPALLISQSALFLLLIFFLIRAHRRIAELQTAFAKMGFVVRQDLQHSFDAALAQVVDAQQQSVEQSQEQIRKTMLKVLDESSQVMQQALARAEKQSSEIVLRAHQDRQRILDDARQESRQYLMRLTDYSAEALEWAMEQLVKEKMDMNGHEELIKSLVSVYLDEHKRV